MPARKIWLTPEDFTRSSTDANCKIVTVGTGTPAPLPVYKPSAWQFPTGVTNTITTNLMIPSDWDGTHLDVYYHWTREQNPNGDIKWEAVWARIAAGEQVDKVQGASDTLYWQGIGPGTPENLFRTPINQGPTWTPAANALIRFAVRRVAITPGYGFYTWLLGVEIVYQASS